MNSVFLKTLYDKRFFILGWYIVFVLIAMLMASFFPAMRPEGGLDALLTNLPAAFQGLIGNLADLREFDTYIASQLFDIRVPLIGGVMAIILGLGLSTREEEDGELRTLLSLPISRSKLFFQKWLAMVLIMAAAVESLVFGVWLVLPWIDDATISFSQVWDLSVMTWLVMVAFGTVTYAAGMATGKRAVAMAIAVTAVIGSFLLSTFAAAVGWLSDYEFLSLLHYFPAVDIVKNGIALSDSTVLAVISLVALLVSWALFMRRDIN